MGEEQSSEGVYGPGIIKETKSKVTMVFTSVLKYWYKYTKPRDACIVGRNTCTTKDDCTMNKKARRCVIYTVMGELQCSIVGNET